MLKKILFLFVVLNIGIQTQAEARTTLLPDFTGLVEDTAHAVVNISARHNPSQEQGDLNRNPQQENPLERFFGIPRQSRPQYRESVSGGSGFIISEDGYILTNRHVIHGADEITVKLSDRREFEATVIGEDEASDIALLKVEAKNLPKLVVGDANAIKIGEWVMAIGSPLSFEQTVTKGIISAKGRPIAGQQYIPYIQSDVPINRGNSGGPLINMDGEVIGINTLIFSNTGGYMGLSFSIPIDVAMSVADQLKAGGSVQRGLLGVNIQPITQKMADYLGLKKPQGALVTNVNKGSAAEKAGIQVQDVITKFNGAKVLTSQNLPPMVGAVLPGTKIDLEIVRDGKVKVIKAKLGGLTADDMTASVTETHKNIGLDIGIELANLTDEEKQELELDSGVKVTKILKRNLLRTGLREGAILLEMGKTPIKNVKHFKNLLKDMEKDEPIVLRVQQGGGNSYIVVERD